MSALTRRGLFGSAAAAALASPALAGAAEPATALVPARQRVVRRGRAIAVAPRSGAVVIAHAARRTIAIRSGGRTRLVDVGGEPFEVATAPNGVLAAVTTASWDQPGLALVRLRGGGRARRIDVGAAPRGVSFTADGEHVVVTGADEVIVVNVARRRVVARRPLGLEPTTVAPVPGTDRVWVALNGRGRIALLNARSGKVIRRLKVPDLPDRIACSGDGKRVLVSHGGRESERVSEVAVASGQVRRHKVGRLPSGVGWTRDGRMVVAVGGAGKIAVISTSGRIARHEVGGEPRGLAVAGARAWTVDALTGRIARALL